MFDCVLLCAGSGTRTKLNYNKILYKIMGKPLYQYSLDLLLNIKEVNKIILVVSKQDFDYFKNIINDDRIKIIIGGDERWDSVYNGLLNCDSDICIIHDGARPFIKEEYVLDVYNNAKVYNASTVGVKVKDTIKVVDKDLIIDTLDRSKLYQVQTPQAVNRKMMLDGLKRLKDDNINIYDDVMVFEKIYNEYPRIVYSDYDNIKITTEEDLEYANFLMHKKLGKEMNMNYYRLGHSNDIHRLVEGRKLILGGIEIDYPKGLLGHSDGDAVLHAVSEAILGALGLGDIGMHFPDTDDKYLNMDSSYFVLETYKKMTEMGYIINNIDIIIFLEKPNMSKYKALIKENIATLLHTNKENVNVKATRKEGLGFIGRGEAIEAECVVMLKRGEVL